MRNHSGFAAILLLPVVLVVLALSLLAFRFIILPFVISTYISGNLEKNEEYKLIRTDNVGALPYFLFEIDRCGIDFTKLCSPSSYFFIGIDLKMHPVIYGWFIEVGRHIELMKKANVNEVLVGYFDFNKKLMGDPNSKILHLEKIDEELYLVKYFENEVFQGEILNGKLAFNEENIIDEVIVSNSAGNQGVTLEQSKWQALENGDASYCNKINDPREKSTCLFTFAIITKESELCQEISERILGNTLEQTRSECKGYAETYTAATQRSASDKCMDLMDNPEKINQFCLEDRSLIECALREADCSLGVKYELAPLCEEHPNYEEAVYPEFCQLLDQRHEEMLKELQLQEDQTP